MKTKCKVIWCRNDGDKDAVLYQWRHIIAVQVERWFGIIEHVVFEIREVENRGGFQFEGLLLSKLLARCNSHNSELGLDI